MENNSNTTMCQLLFTLAKNIKDIIVLDQMRNFINESNSRFITPNTILIGRCPVLITLCILVY